MSHHVIRCLSAESLDTEKDASASIGREPTLAQPLSVVQDQSSRTDAEPRRIARPERLYRFVVAVVIVGVLGFQASLIPARIIIGFSGEWWWPFIDYPMYDKPHFENDYPEVYFTLEVVTHDGELLTLDQEDFGMGFWNFFRLTNDMQKGEDKAVSLFMDIYDKSDDVAEIRLYSSPYIVTRGGRADAEPKLLRTISPASISIGTSKP